MRFDEIFEVEHLVDHRRQQAVRSHLIDVRERALHGIIVRLDSQLRAPGEIQHAVTEELQVLLECGAGRESRIVAAIDAVQDQLAARRGDITQ